MAKSPESSPSEQSADYAPPCLGQASDEIEAWLRANVTPGAEIVIRDTQGGFLHYRKVLVSGIKKGRFYIANAGDCDLGAPGLAWTFKGRNCFQPKGQSRVVIPTEAVLAYINLQRRGDLVSVALHLLTC